MDGDSFMGTCNEVSGDEMASIEIQQQSHADIHIPFAIVLILKDFF
jgi:hypothetical protein